MGRFQELRIDKDLIDSNFEGYKLSLTEIPGSNNELPADVHKLENTGDHFSYLYLTLFSLHNHLISDPWNDNVVYYVNKTFRVIRITLDVVGNVECMDELLLLPCPESVQDFRYNSTIIFASPEYAMISDGACTLHVVNTGIRSESQNWNVECSHQVLGENIPFIALDARIVDENNIIELHCLLTNIVERKEEKTSAVSRASTDLHWVVLKKNDNRTWVVESSFKMNSSGAVKYASFSPRCECAIIESTKPVKLPDDEPEPTVEDAKKDPQYYWQQSVEDIKVWFALPQECVREDVQINVTQRNLNIAVKSETLLAGETFQQLNADLTTWDITNNRVEIVLWKTEAGRMWRHLIETDDRGEEVVDPELVKEIHERLSHLCSENEAVFDDSSPAFNPEQLEACDNVPDDDSRLVTIDRSSKKITHEILLSGHQKLFNVRASPLEAPYLCLRHDVDGTLWSVDFHREALCQHVGTLNAFGYVLASKQWKYSTCSPDFSYAAIATTKQNVFVYKQHCAVNGDLRNRKTGHKFAKVGKQFLITLSNSDEILGLHASDDFLFVLTRSSVFVYRMKSVD